MTSNERRAVEKSLEQGLQLGLQKGLYQGRIQERLRALNAERALLKRLASHQFDPVIAEQLAALLQPIDDTERLAEIAEWIIDSPTGEVLLARVWRELDHEDG